MNDKTQRHEIREPLEDKSSVGYELTQVLYGNKEERVKYAKNRKVPVNLSLRRSDLTVVDAIANKYGKSRAWLLAYLLESDIERMFDGIYGLNAKMQSQLALAIDNKMSERGLEHDYKGKTWVWAASELAGQVNNPGAYSPLDKKPEKDDQ